MVSIEGGGYCFSIELCVPVPDWSQAAQLWDLVGDCDVGSAEMLELLGHWG
jgi:hypothetical protein